MYIFYLDESGCTGTLQTGNPDVQPLFIIAGVVLDQSLVATSTRDIIELKKRFFPAHLPSTAKHLEWATHEIKGSYLLKTFREGGHRRQSLVLAFIEHMFRILEDTQALILGRVLVKQIDAAIDGTSLYTSSMQAMTACFHHLLVSDDDSGVAIIDSRRPAQNSNLSHSLFTQKYQIAGDRYPRLLEMPTFGHSENHAGLQLADWLCSALIRPIATATYFDAASTPHFVPEYQLIKDQFTERLRNLQYRFQEENGKWKGGITINDPSGQRSGALMFRLP